MINASEIKNAMQSAVENLQNGKLEEAAAICEKLLKSNARYGDAFHLLGVIKHQQGELNIAVDHLQKAISINNRAARYHSALGGVLAMAGDFANAKISLARSLSIEPKGLETLYNQGLTCLNLGDMTDAIDLFRKASQLAPQEAEFLVKLGVAYHGSGDYDSAIGAYRKAAKLNSSNPEIFYNLGLSLSRMDQMDEALQVFENTVKIEPKFQPAYSQICNIKRTAGDFAGAAIAGRKAVELNPKDLKTLMDLSYALTGTGDTKDAVAFSKQAQELAPGSFDQQLGLSYSYICNDELENALTSVDECLSTVPNHIGALCYKSAALNGLDRREEAGVLLDFDRLIHIKVFDEVKGHDSVDSFNEALSAHIHAHPSLSYSDENRSLSFGQGTDDIFEGASSDVLETFHSMIEIAITEYMAANPEDGDHPFLSKHPKTHHLYSWGNIMDKNGFHDVHFHPQAWLSGVYYPHLPKAVEDANDAHEGWIEFGRSFYMFKSTDNPPVRLVKPQEGLIVLFPSYFGHRTIPFTSDEKRISIAFDMIADTWI